MGIHDWTVASLLSSASRRSPPSAQKGTLLKLTSVQFTNGLRPSNKWPVRQDGLFVHVCFGQVKSVRLGTQ